MTIEVTQPARPSTWTRSILFVLVGPLVSTVGVLSIATSSGLNGAHAEQLASRAGNLLWVMCFAGWGLERVSRQRSGLWTWAWLGVNVLGAVFLGSALKPVPQDWTARERVAMQLRTVAGEVRLVHPTLGFSIKVPEGLAVDTEALSALSAMIALYPSTHAYAFSTPDSKVRIRVVGFKAKHIAPRVFAQAFASLESGMIRQFAANAGDLTVRWLQDDVQPDARKAELHVVVGEAHARARALVDQLGTGNELMIMLSVESASDQAVSIAESFRTNDL